MSTNKTNCSKKRSISLVKAISILTLIAVLALSLVIFAACGKKQTGPKMIFSDEFDSDTVDTEKWIVHGDTPKEGDPGEVRRGGWWTTDSVSQKDGNLVIRTTYDPEKNTFYTGSVDTKQLFTYGYYEARCKVPEAAGIWAAFWIMCDKMGLEEPDAHIGGAEIDIFESPFYTAGGTVQHAVHTGGYGANQQEQTKPFVTLSRSEGVKNGYEEWHTFALDWQPDYYKFYIDGELTYETCAPYRSERDPNYKEKNVSSVPSCIILSVEVNGENTIPGTLPFTISGHPVSGNSQKYDMNDFAVDFLVDYVRVWESDPHA